MASPARSHGRRAISTLFGLGVAAATALSATAPAASASSTPTPPQGHAMTPAIGVTPHYRLAGSAENAPAGTTFGCQTTQPAGCYGPDQIRAAYGVNTLAARGLDGRGRTIVIVDAYSSPTIRQDLATFNELFGLPSADFRQVAPDGLTPFDQSDTNQVGWAGEITLDVEWSHAIAPKADLVLVLAKSNQDADILSATRYAVNHDLGDVISQSFGEAEQCMDPQLLKEQRNLFQQATRKHITLLASSGDEGSAQPTCDGSSFFKAASTPASDPDVTGVGGTRLFADGLTGAYDSESVWNEPEFEAAGGGGFSAVYGTPSYQKSMHLPSRGVPDVADNAAIIGGVLAVWSTSGRGAGLVFRFGGTSAGSPQWAGLVALADQLGGRRIGMMNHKLYGLAHAQKRYAANLHDITMGDNTFHGPVTISGFAAQRGWDAASGLGSPKADHLVPTLAGGR